MGRGGAGSGYNYDDDYYAGQGGGAADDPYYEEAPVGGWADDYGDGGRDAGPYWEEGRRRSGGSSRRGGRGASGAGFDLTGTITRGNKKYGVYALVGSTLLTMMGVSLMFEKNLIRLGNLGFVAGIALFIGPSNVMRYFSQSSKLRGAIIFAAGFFFVFTGHPIIGLAIEAFGFLNLFGNMLPMVWAMASNMPVVKDIIGSGAQRRKRSGRERSGRGSRTAPSRAYDYDRQYYEEEEWGYDEYER